MVRMVDKFEGNVLQTLRECTSIFVSVGGVKERRVEMLNRLTVQITSKTLSTSIFWLLKNVDPNPNN